MLAPSEHSQAVTAAAIATANSDDQEEIRSTSVTTTSEESSSVEEVSCGDVTKSISRESVDSDQVVQSQPEIAEESKSPEKVEEIEEPHVKVEVEVILETPPKHIDNAEEEEEEGGSGCHQDEVKVEEDDLLNLEKQEVTLPPEVGEVVEEKQESDSHPLTESSLPLIQIQDECSEVTQEGGVDVIKNMEREEEILSVSEVTTGGVDEVVEILSNLQSQKTPEPEEVDAGVVRASFVDFALEEGPMEEQPDDDEDEEDPVTTTDVTPGDNAESQFMSDLTACNPELQKIREEQVRKWLIFEQENPLDSSKLAADSLAESLGELRSIEQDSLADGGHYSVAGGNLTEDENGELVVNGVDGMPRRVRFLTDQEGNLLISVFMSKLVTFFLFLMKIASGGVLDFLPPLSTTPSSSDTVAQDHPSRHNSFQSTDSTNSSQVSSLNSFSSTNSSSIVVIDPMKPQHASIFIDSTPTVPGSEGDSSIVSNGTSEDLIISEHPQQNGTGGNPSLVVSPPSLDSSTDPSAPTSSESSEEEDSSEAPSIVLVAPVNLKEAPNEKPPAPPIDDDIDEGCNSSDETMSVSSCNSMIEIVPSQPNSMDKPDEPTIIIDENNNEVKKEPPAILECELEQESMSKTSPVNFQLNTSLDTEQLEVEECTGSTTSSQQGSLIIHELEEHQEGMAAQNGLMLPSSGPEAMMKLPNIDENNNVVESNLAPEIFVSEGEPAMPELRRSTSSSPDGDEERMSPPADHPPPPPNTTPFSGALSPQGSSSNEEEEQQMVSLCIQEEHISAVAVTIAKWESMSKAQSTENLSTIIPSPVNGHAPVTKTSSSPCPKRSFTSPVNCAKPVQFVAPVIQHNNKDISKPSTPRVIYKENSVTSHEPLILNKAPGWNCWGNKVNDHHNKTIKEQNGGASDDEIIYAQPNLQAGSTMTSITNPSTILKAYPKPLSKGEIINWLKEGEIHRAGLLLNYGQSHHHAPVMTQSTPNNHPPVVVSWFFGLISRQQAEKYLHGQPSGTFLVRISTRIWGYTLSYQAASGRTKHFLISATNPAVPATIQKVAETNLPPQTGKQQRMSPFMPQGKYAFIGTNMTPYGTLVSLIRHHSHAPITKLGGEKLLNACPGGPQVAGLELLFK